MKWHWELVDVTRSGAAGDVSKLFKNEAIKEPGALREDAPPVAATVLAREVVQNSWDAARELAVQLEEDDEDPVDFLLEFRFADVSGDRKSALVEAIGLSELAARLQGVEDTSDDATAARAQLGLAVEHRLDSVADESRPLRLLEIREYGTTGMYGPFTGTSSKLYLALVSIGFTVKGLGSGGSYGYGKAGLIGGSGTRTVVAYTCFRERKDDPGVTRRLLGMTYWGRHDLDDHSYTGFARFGDASGGDVPVPFENEEADRIAAGLGLDVRSPDEVSDLGTTFLLIEPTVAPQSLCNALERNWWPALVSNRFDIDVFTSNGEHIIPRPRTNPLLLPFIRGYELATVSQDSDVEHEWSRKFRRFTARSESTYELGSMGLVADLGPAGWSYPSTGETDDSRHRSLVALVRGPRMVVEYMESGSVTPFVRGTFLASDEVDDILRQTEPKGHDSWEARGDLDGVHRDAEEIVRTITARIRQQVGAFRKELRPAAPEQRDIRLPVLEELFRKMLDGTGSRTVGPSPGDRPVSIEVVDQELRRFDGRIRLIGSVEMCLNPSVGLPLSAAEVRLRYVFLEDGRSGAECAMDIAAPDSFTTVDGVPGGFRGELTDEPVIFSFTTAPYEADWSGKLAIACELIPTEAEA